MLKHSSAVIIFVNQVRANLSGYGAPEMTGGGMALRHTLQVRIHIKPRDKIKSGEREIGFFAELKTLKNKVATPFRVVRIPILFGRGFVPDYELITLGIQAKILTKQGQSYQLKAKMLGRDWRKAAETINANSKVREFVINKILEFLETKTTMQKET